MNERARKEPPRDPGAYIGRKPERWTESVERNPGRIPGRPGMRRPQQPDRPAEPAATPPPTAQGATGETASDDTAPSLPTGHADAPGQPGASEAKDEVARD